MEKQEFIGFGGSFTDSSGYNYALMTAEDKKKTLELLFGETGLKYRFCRLCIGSSDFATEEYCYVKEGDERLESFSIDRDKKYVIPFIKDAMAYAKYPITFIASPWSPPAFMKTNACRFEGGKLKKEYYEVYAEYLIKFLLAYKEEGIDISMLTLQNEAKAVQTWESCVYTAEEEAEFACVLSECLDKYNLNVQLLCWDHNKERLYDRASAIFEKCGDKMSGIAFHWYSGDHFEAIDMLRKLYPNKLLLETEFCKTDGGLDFVETSYAREVINNLSHGAHGICEWNLILDENGGPYHNRGGSIASPVRFDGNTCRATSIYREMYMFSHFIADGAKALYTSTFDVGVFVSAFKNPNGEIVVNILNELDREFPYVKVYVNGQFVAVPLKAKSLLTVVLEN